MRSSSRDASRRKRSHSPSKERRGKSRRGERHRRHSASPAARVARGGSSQSRSRSASGGSDDSKDESRKEAAKKTREKLDEANRPPPKLRTLQTSQGIFQRLAGTVGLRPKFVVGEKPKPSKTRLKEQLTGQTIDLLSEGEDAASPISDPDRESVAEPEPSASGEDDLEQ